MITETTPTKTEFDKAFYCLFEDGDYTAMANYSGHTPEYASQLHSPTGDRRSNLYRAFRDLRAVREKDPARGDKALALLIEFVTRGLELDTRHISEAELVRELNEAEVAELEKKPKSVRLRENREAMAVLAKKNLEIERDGLPPVRVEMAKVVEQKRSNGHR